MLNKTEALKKKRLEENQFYPLTLCIEPSFQKRFKAFLSSVDISVFCRKCQLKKKKNQQDMHSLILTFLDCLVLFPWQTYLFLREQFKILPHAGLHLLAGWSLRRLQNKASWAPAGTVCSQPCRPGCGLGTVGRAQRLLGNCCTRSASSLTTCVGSTWPALYLHKFPNGLWHR